MEKSDGFWQWGNARKRMEFSKINSVADGFRSMPKKTSSVADGFRSMAMTTSSVPDGSFSVAKKTGYVACGFSLKTPNEEGLLNNKQGTFSLKAPNEEGLLNNNQSTDTVSIHRSHVISVESALNVGGLCKDLGLQENSRMKVMKVYVSRKGKVNSRMSTMSVIQGLNISSSSKTNSSDLNTIPFHPNVDLTTQLQFLDRNCRQKEMESRFRVWKRCQKPANIQKENSESFAAINMLADVAAWVLESDLPVNKEEDKNSGIIRVVGNFSSHCVTDLTQVSNQKSQEFFQISSQHNQVRDSNLADNGQREIPDVRS